MAGSSFLSTVKAGCPEALLASAKEKGPFVLLVVRAAGSLPMQAAFDAWKVGIASPLLIGEPDIIQTHANQLGWDIRDDMILPATGEQEAASVAARYLIQKGTDSVGAVMKGQLHTDVFMGALLPRDVGLRTGNRLVHVFALYPAAVFAKATFTKRNSETDYGRHPIPNDHFTPRSLLQSNWWEQERQEASRRVCAA